MLHFSDYYYTSFNSRSEFWSWLVFGCLVLYVPLWKYFPRKPVTMNNWLFLFCSIKFYQPNGLSHPLKLIKIVKKFQKNSSWMFNFFHTVEIFCSDICFLAEICHISDGLFLQNGMDIKWKQHSNHVLIVAMLQNAVLISEFFIEIMQKPLTQALFHWTQHSQCCCIIYVRIDQPDSTLFWAVAIVKFQR